MVKIKIFGTIRSNFEIKELVCEAETLSDALAQLNQNRIQGSDEINFEDAVTFINGIGVADENCILGDGDEVWFMSPAIGG